MSSLVVDEPPAPTPLIRIDGLVFELWLTISFKSNSKSRILLRKHCEKLESLVCLFEVAFADDEILWVELFDNPNGELYSWFDIDDDKLELVEVRLSLWLVVCCCCWWCCCCCCKIVSSLLVLITSERRNNSIALCLISAEWSHIADIMLS